MSAALIVGQCWVTFSMKDEGWRRKDTTAGRHIMYKLHSLHWYDIRFEPNLFDNKGESVVSMISRTALQWYIEPPKKIAAAPWCTID